MRDWTLRIAAALAIAATLLAAGGASAADRKELTAQARQALSTLYASQPVAKKIASKSVGVLVFPEILKGGVFVGGAGGDGVLFKGGKVAGYYRSLAASYGLQFGFSKFGYAMMFMTKDALSYLDQSKGWEVGVGPSVVVADEAVQKRLSTTTEQAGIYVFFFDQKGFFAGAGIEGAKITRLD